MQKDISRTQIDAADRETGVDWDIPPPYELHSSGSVLASAAAVNGGYFTDLDGASTARVPRADTPTKNMVVSTSTSPRQAPKNSRGSCRRIPPSGRMRRRPRPRLAAGDALHSTS